ncbi:unnamed protein product [Rhizophagus irregularis]|nr:unnamed protein product [Rhizophagus irregularis]
MFTCPYQRCGRTFSRRAALCEHTKSHKGQAYWEILTDTSSNFNNFEHLEERNNDNRENNNDLAIIFTFTPIAFFIFNEQVENINDNNDSDINDNDNSFAEYDDEQIGEDINEQVEHIHNYNLHFPEQINQSTLSINIRPIRNIPNLPDAAYTEFMELASTHKFSDSAGNDVLK